MSAWLDSKLKPPSVVVGYGQADQAMPFEGAVVLPGNVTDPGGDGSRGAKGIPRVVGHVYGVAHLQPVKNLAGLLHHHEHGRGFFFPDPELMGMFDPVNSDFHAFQLIVSHEGFSLFPRTGFSLQEQKNTRFFSKQKTCRGIETLFPPFERPRQKRELAKVFSAPFS
jgi:hypothetical protein